MKRNKLLALSLLLTAFIGMISGKELIAAENDDSGQRRIVMISAHGPDQISIVDEDGQSLWTIGKEKGVDHPQDAAVLEDGSVFFSVMFGAKKFRISDKSELWSYSTPEGTQNPVAQPLDNGYFLVGNEGPCRLLEINTENDVRREVKVNDSPFAGSHGQFRFCRKTSDNTYLFPMINASILREYDSKGKLLRQFPISGMPVCALRLPDGITLTGDGTAVEEINANNEIVWKFDCVRDGGYVSGIVTAVSRLKNGNTLIGYYHADPNTPDVIEISADKKVVWSLTLKEVSLVAAVQLLDNDWKPSDEVLVR